ncbi:MAG: tyrosine-type recombinase/integrase [Bacteroidota bacterium]
MAKRKTRARWGDGNIRQLGPNRFEVRASAGFDSEGHRVRPSRTVTGSRSDALAVLKRLQGELRDETYVEQHQMSVAKWLREWLDDYIKPPAKAPRTYERYKGVVEQHLIPALGKVPLQKLRGSQIRRHFDDCEGKLDRSTLALHCTVLNSALNAAIEDGLLRSNPVSTLKRRPKRKTYEEDLEAQEEIVENCWEAEEARRFLEVARAAGPQWAAFFALALDTGMRKSELCGLEWRDIDWNDGAVTVRQQLARTPKGEEPRFSVTKGRQARRIYVAPQTLRLLREHRKRQAEVKLASGGKYKDFGLVFAKEPGPRVRRPGYPLQANNLGERIFADLVEMAKVRKIKFHGLRHTCATLLLNNRVPVHYVSRRLGHKDELTTMRIYAHSLPSADKEFAAELAQIIGLGELEKTGPLAGRP